MFLRTFFTDVIKSKNTFALWLTVLGAGFIPAVLFLIGFNKPEFVATKQNIWEIYFERGHIFSIIFFMPFFVVLVISLLVQIEHKSNTWKHLLTLPIGKAEIYFSKLLLILTMLVLCYFLFVVFLLGGGFLLGIVHPKLPFLSQTPNFQFITKTGIKLFVASLAITSIHYWASLRIKNQILPIGIGLIGIVSTLILNEGWKNIVYFPWAFPLLTYKFIKQPEFWLNHEWRSLAYFAVITLLGYLDFSRFYKA
ncbi:MAG: ABC transporter permease [Verrucomicrobia bacterium]|nr:ABC transporter permease [Cytophagales bacterium]